MCIYVFIYGKFELIKKWQLPFVCCKRKTENCFSWSVNNKR